MAVCKTVAFGLNKFESYHSHNGESPVGRGSCLENSPGVMPQEFESLSLRCRVFETLRHNGTKSQRKDNSSD